MVQKRILLTGWTGGIGQALFNELKKTDAEIYCCSRRCGTSDIGNLHTRRVNIEDDFSFSLFVQEAQPTHLIHLAGTTKNTATTWAVNNYNVVPTSDLIEWAPKGCRFIFASSSTVYGDSPYGMSYERDPLKPTTPYGAGKVYCEQLINMATRRGKISGVNLRFSAVVGKYAKHGLLKYIVDTIKQGKKLSLFGNKPGLIKPYLHVDDAVQTILLLLNSDHTGAFNVAPDDEGSTSSVLDYVGEVWKERYNAHKYWNPVLEWTGEKYDGDNLCVSLDNQKLRSIGWKPAYPTTESAIKKVAEELL